MQGTGRIADSPISAFGVADCLLRRSRADDGARGDKAFLAAKPHL